MPDEGSSLPPLPGLASILEQAYRRWPAVAPPVGFADFLRRCVPADHAPADWLATAPTDDLYLACACTERSPAALDEFERIHVATVARHLARFRPTQDFIDEVKQGLRERLFVGAGGPPKIGEYSGRGPLGAWVRVMAMRIALNLQRRKDVPWEPGRFGATSISGEAEAHYVKQRYGSAVQRAIQRAVDEISPEQRRLLKLHFVEGRTFDELSAQMGIHKVTVWRHVAAARAALANATRAIMLREGTVGANEFESILRTVHSQLVIHLSKP
jgi:RNA polymerase sigma-70 factor (ECF subfamily)